MNRNVKYCNNVKHRVSAAACVAVYYIKYKSNAKNLNEILKYRQGKPYK